MCGPTGDAANSLAEGYSKVDFDATYSVQMCNFLFAPC